MGKKFLIIGNCGVGKTWVMRKLIEKLQLTEKSKVGLLHYLVNENNIVTGVYEGGVFDGSDKLSMAVMRDVQKFVAENQNKNIFFEGDRFTNSNFIKQVEPIILKIRGDGSNGRATRGSFQSATHVKSIATRVTNIEYDYAFFDSQECYNFIEGFLGGNNVEKIVKAPDTLF